MAQHKAPTAVTVAPLQEKTGFALWISRHWMHGALLVIAVAAALVIRHRMESQEVTARSDSWDKLSAKLVTNRTTGQLEGDVAAVASLAVELKDTVAGPSARLAEVKLRLEKGDFAGALAAIDALEREHPTHPWVTDTFHFGDKQETAIASLRASIGARQAFEAAHPGLKANPPPAPEAKRVRIVTDKGSFVVALYSQQAPKHCENFLKLCGEGYYNSTKFHRTKADFMIQGGDPNSKEGDPATWGQGGPAYKVDPEPSDELFHFPGALAMAKQGGETQSSGSQFYVTTAPTHWLDGQHTVFGTVVEGMDVVIAISELPLQPNTEDKPVTPVVLTSTEVL